MSGGDAVLYYASKGRLRRRTRASTDIARNWVASYTAVVAGAGGAGHSLARTTSGIIFSDTFNRSDRALNGDNGWVDDTGTWNISSNQATNTSAGNYDRNRNTGVSAATAVYEANMKAINGSNYCGIRCLAPSSSDDYHIFMNGGNTDKRLARAANTDTTIASITMTMDTNFNVHKLLYTTVPDGSRDFVYWFNRVAKLGSVATPFHSTTGPTVAGAVGFISYAGAALYDWVLVSSDHFITVTGLSAGYGFRLFDGSSSLIGSSGSVTAGSATLDVATLFDGLFTGSIQVYSDQGTWATPITGGRYPSSSTAADICGGDSYAFS